MADRDLGAEILDGLNEIKAFKKSLVQGLQEAIELNQGGKVAAKSYYRQPTNSSTPCSKSPKK